MSKYDAIALVVISFNTSASCVSTISENQDSHNGFADANYIDAGNTDSSLTLDAANGDTGPECLNDFDICNNGAGSCFNGACILARSCHEPICNPVPNHVTPDTNQRQCYNESTSTNCSDLPCREDGADLFCGQDAQYGWDVLHSANSRYIRENATFEEPTVSDNVTFRMWQGCAEGLSGADCSVGSEHLLGWYQAIAYCEELSWAGWTDWRLPSRHELQTIVDYGRNSPSIDIAAFPNTPGENRCFWSISVFADGVDQQWTVEFGFGGIQYSNGSCHVRCIRN